MRRSAPPFLLRSTFPVNFAVTAVINGNISVEQLNAACGKVRQKHTLLGVHVVADEDGAAWYETEGTPDLPIRIVKNGDWVVEVEQELNQVFDASISLVRLVLVTNEQQTSLIMVCQHAIADGLSAAYVLRDILFYIANPDSSVEPLPISPILDDLVPAVDLEKIDFSGPSRPQSGIHGVEGHDELSLYVLAASLSKSQTAALVSRCRQEQTSVHATLSVAFLTALEQLEQDEQSVPRILSSPINLRDRLSQPIGEQFGFYISPSVKTTLDCCGQGDFWELAREFRTSLSRDVAGEGVFKSLYYFAYMRMRAARDKNFKWMDGQRFADYDMSITNIGSLDFPVEYGALRLEAIYGPAVNPLGREKVMGVATVGGVMTFTFVAPYQLIDRPMGEQLMQMATQILANAVSW